MTDPIHPGDWIRFLHDTTLVIGVVEYVVDHTIFTNLGLVTGAVLEVRHPQGSPIMTSTLCPTCDGSGHSSFGPCITCEGAGRVLP